MAPQCKARRSGSRASVGARRLDVACEAVLSGVQRMSVLSPFMPGESVRLCAGGALAAPRLLSEPNLAAPSRCSCSRKRRLGAGWSERRASVRVGVRSRTTGGRRAGCCTHGTSVSLACGSPSVFHTRIVLSSLT
eukprot:scaffold224268_cov30-Tisochrysis_lutea.AAC.1